MTSRYWRWLKWGSLGLSIGSIVIAAGLMWANQKDGLGETAPQPAGTPAAAEKPQAKVEKPLIIERKGDRIIWRLQAESAKQQEHGMHLSLPHLELFTESGEMIPVDSREAWFEPEKHDIRFKGGVRVRYREWQLQTEELRYESGRDQLRVPGRFRLFRPDVTMKGRGMRVDRRNEKLYVEHDVWLEDARPDGLGSAK